MRFLDGRSYKPKEQVGFQTRQNAKIGESVSLSAPLLRASITFPLRCHRRHRSRSRTRRAAHRSDQAVGGSIPPTGDSIWSRNRHCDGLLSCAGVLDVRPGGSNYSHPVALADFLLHISCWPLKGPEKRCWKDLRRCWVGVFSTPFHTGNIAKTPVFSHISAEGPESLYPLQTSLRRAQSGANSSLPTIPY